jgi:RNAse (barnase) inhibitor barstar
MYWRTRKIKIDGKQINSEKDFVSDLSNALKIDDERFESISELRKYLSENKTKVLIYWANSQDSENLLVRKSNVPIDELPKDGSLMQREIILDLIWKKQSLLDKVKELMKDLENVKLIMK